jgi:hypothetical protein
VKEVVGAAVERCGGYDLVARAGQRLNDQRLSRLTGCRCQTSGPAFECSNALLKDVSRRIRQATVDIAKLLQRETPRSLSRILEDERCGLVDGLGSRACVAIDNLSCVNCERGKLLFRSCGFL